jgi:glutathione peroxidase
MTARQTLLRLIYPFWMFYNRLFKKRARVIKNEKNILPFQSFYTLSAQLNDGSELRFDSLKGKKVLLVNTASDCGYTNQYDDLQKISELYNDRLIVIGFPANDFKEQEKGSDEEIAQFCKLNFGVSFPLMKKSTVIKSVQQNNIFQWLTDSTKNGWNNKPPTWNFTKYLVNEEGMLTDYFGSSIPPMSKDVIDAINKK